MEASDWAEVFCLEEDWVEKKQKIIAALNKQYGDGFASVHGDFLSLVSSDGRTIQIGAVSQKEYRLGKRLDSGKKTGTPITGKKLIYHIGNFIDGIATG